jgi:hypothetical protein
MSINKQIRIRISLIGTSVLVLASIFLSTLPASATATNTASLSLSPTRQTVSNGSNINVILGVNSGGNPINAVQTVLSYSTANYSIVKVTAGPKFGNLVHKFKNGSIYLTAAASEPVTSATTLTAATISFKAKTNSTSNFSLANICPVGNYGISCSAVYNSTTNSNVLVKITSPASATVKLSAKQVNSTVRASKDILYVLILLFLLFCIVRVNAGRVARKKL